MIVIVFLHFKSFTYSCADLSGSTHYLIWELFIYPFFQESHFQIQKLKSQSSCHSFSINFASAKSISSLQDIFWFFSPEWKEFFCQTQSIESCVKITLCSTGVLRFAIIMILLEFWTFWLHHLNLHHHHHHPNFAGVLSFLAALQHHHFVCQPLLHCQQCVQSQEEVIIYSFHFLNPTHGGGGNL